jgi:hypothetical protein
MILYLIFVGEDPIESSTDIHAVCDLVKSWFRVLPEPVFPSTDYHLVIEAMRMFPRFSSPSVLTLLQNWKTSMTG